MPTKKKGTPTKGPRSRPAPLARAPKPPPPIMDDGHAAYVRVPVEAETVQAVRELVEGVGGLFRAAAGLFSALERETRGRRRR